jgi:hypothetical protein
VTEERDEYERLLAAAEARVAVLEASAAGLEGSPIKEAKGTVVIDNTPELETLRSELEGTVQACDGPTVVSVSLVFCPSSLRRFLQQARSHGWLYSL